MNNSEVSPGPAEQSAPSPATRAPETAKLQYLDPDYLAMPFFEDRHRELARDLDAWLRDTEVQIQTALALSPDGVSRQFVRLLGSGGWLGKSCRPAPDFRNICLIREALAYRHDLLDFAFAIQSLAAASIALHGSEKQQARFLPGLASGEIIGSFAVSEAGAGSDPAASTMLRAERDSGYYCLDGEKCWISHADIADFHVVLARTQKTTGAIGLSVIVVDANTPGLTSVPVELIAPRSFGNLRFENCRVPADRIIGMEGGGLAVVLDVLERYRVTVAAAANGFSRTAWHETRNHARSRRIGKLCLADLPVVRQQLADIAVAIETAGLVVARAAWELDDGAPRSGIRSSVAKLHATECAQGVIDRCLQLHGAAGLVKGSLLERLYREIRSLRIYEGTSEVQKLIIGEAAAKARFM